MGIITMLVSLATGIGLQQKIRQKVSAFNGAIIISNYTGNQSDVSTDPISKHQKFYPKFTQVDGISHIQAVASKAGIIRTEKAFEGIILKGVGADYDWDLVTEYLVEGRPPKTGGEITNEVVISQYLANRLQLKTGQVFTTFFMKEEGNQMPKARRFMVSGIYNSGIQEYDSSYILGDIRHIQRLNRWKPDMVGSFEVFISDFDQLEAQKEAVYNATPSNLNVQSIADKYYYIFDWINLFDTNILVIIIIMTIVAVINMIVALLVLIFERTQMIGILKALGSNSLSIRKIFIYNALYLLFYGLVWGNGIALLFLFLQKYFGIIKLSPENYYVSVAPVALNFWSFLAVNVFTILTALSIMLLSSKIITRITPSKAIRFQ